MIQTMLLYRCRALDSKIRLYIERYTVGEYPITYTLQECLEEFCESVDWRLLRCYGFRFEQPSYEDVYDILSGVIF